MSENSLSTSHRTVVPSSTSGDQRTPRLLGVDVARGLAYLGMVFVNFRVVIALGDEASPAARIVGLLEGRAAALFVVLAGVGLALMGRRALLTRDAEARRTVRRRILARAGVLLVAGFAYLPLWPADILHFYGVYLAVGALLLYASDRWLLGAATALVVVQVPMLVGLDYEREWDWATLHYEGLWTPAGIVRHLFHNGYHPVVPWAAFLLLGVWLGRRDLSDRDTRRRLAILGTSVWLGAEAASAFLVAAVHRIGGVSPGDAEGLEALVGTAMIPPVPLYMAAASGLALTLVVLSVGVARRRRDGPVVRALAATGQLALTLYVAHVVVGMGALELLGLLDAGSAAFAAATATVFCVLSIAFAVAWRRRFARGPLEALLRKLAD